MTKRNKNCFLYRLRYFNVFGICLNKGWLQLEKDSFYLLSDFSPVFSQSCSNTENIKSNRLHKRLKCLSDRRQAIVSKRDSDSRDSSNYEIQPSFPVMDHTQSGVTRYSVHSATSLRRSSHGLKVLSNHEGDCPFSAIHSVGYRHKTIKWTNSSCFNNQHCCGKAYHSYFDMWCWC